MLLERIRQTTSSRMAFFVGAGISVSSGLPNFQQLSQRVIGDIVGDALEEREIDLLSRNLRPELILQIAVEELEPMVLRSLQLLTGGKPNANHYFLAEAIRRGNWVFTTNVDNLIEKAGRLIGIEIDRCYEDWHFQRFGERLLAGEDVAGCLFKLHGTIEEEKPFEERYNTILVALHQVGRGLSDSRQRVLSYSLTNFDLCVMGYSFQDDFSVNPVLLDTDSDKSVFWLSYAGVPMEPPVSDKGTFRRQKDVEENKAPGEKRDWQTINVHSFLLKRNEAFKFIGDSSKFVEDTVCPALGIDTGLATSVKTAEKWDEEYARWAVGISHYKRNLIAGSLYRSLFALEKAKHFYELAGRAADQEEQKGIMQSRLGQIYLIPSTRESDERAIEVFQKALDVFVKLNDLFEAACTKTDLSNALRRRRRFPEAKRHIEEARGIFENNILSADKEEDEGHNLAYAKCLNIFGLLHFGLGADSKSEEHFQVGLDLCGKSRSLKQKFGDIDGIAESDNATALILMERAMLPGKSRQEAASLLNNAIRYLEAAVKSRERIGNFRGCFQHCRNLGLTHSRLANLAGDKSEKESYIRLVRKDYEDGMAYLSRIRPEPPPGEILECQFRIGELDVQLGEMEDAVRRLVPVESRRQELGDWHNRARTLDLLRKAFADIEHRKHYCFEILSIYRDVLDSDQKIQEIRDTRIKLTNANDILRGTAKALVDMGFSDLATQAFSMSEELTRVVE